MDIRGGDLTAKFVQTDYFLCRVREFEQKYHMDWGKFLAEFRTGKLPADPDVYAEYTEWAFLCDTFLKELIELESPPGEEHADQKPEFDSGFWIFLERTCSTLTSTSNTATKSLIPAKIA